MEEKFNYKKKSRKFFQVLLPIFISQLAIVSIGFFDTIMAGHVSEQDLAGVAVGVNLFMPFYIACLGIVSGLTPRIAYLYGEGNHAGITFVVRQGFYWTLGLIIALLALGYGAVPYVLPWLHLGERVHYVVVHFLLALSLGVPPIMLAAVLRNLIDALGKTHLTMMITVCTVPITIVLNYIFIFGAFGVPALGGVGAGVGTATAYYINLLLNVLVVCKVGVFHRYAIFEQWAAPKVKEWKHQLGLGLPIGGTIFCEQSIFNAVGLIMAIYGTEILAAHQAAMNFVAVVYMIPLSVSITLTILVGFELGAGRLNGAKTYARLGRFLSMAFAISLATIFYHLRPEIAMLYSNNAAVRQMIEAFLAYAIVMQVSDGINAPLQGTLRGYKDVQASFLLAVLSFWGLGLPSGWICADLLGQGPYGYWVGLTFGVLAGAAMLEFRLRIVERRYAKTVSAENKN